MLEILHLPKEQHDFAADVSRNSPSSNVTKVRILGIQNQEVLERTYDTYFPSNASMYMVRLARIIIK
jgi:hypothetical protein